MLHSTLEGVDDKIDAEIIAVRLRAWDGLNICNSKQQKLRIPLIGQMAYIYSGRTEGFDPDARIDRTVIRTFMRAAWRKMDSGTECRLIGILFAFDEQAISTSSPGARRDIAKTVVCGYSEDKLKELYRNARQRYIEAMLIVISSMGRISRIRELASIARWKPDVLEEILAIADDPRAARPERAVAMATILGMASWYGRCGAEFMVRICDLVLSVEPEDLFLAAEIGYLTGLRDYLVYAIQRRITRSPEDVTQEEKIYCMRIANSLESHWRDGIEKLAQGSGWDSAREAALKLGPLLNSYEPAHLPH